VAVAAKVEPSPRQRLVDAVAALNAARDRLARLEAAFHEAGEASLQAAMALEEAEEKVKELAKSASATLAARALGEVPTNADALAEAERALDAAQKKRAAAKEVRAALEAEIATQSGRVEWAERAVADAVDAALVGAPEIEKLLAAYDRAVGTVDDLADAIRSLPFNAVPGRHPARFVPWDKYKGAIVPNVPIAPRWRHALEALRRGEDVALPDVE
jgi:chromosome segregation ATPase